MCGINGCNFHDEARIRSMNYAIRHRGPDADGIFLDDNVSLGHVLLSVRDVVEYSRQPFYKSDSPWVMQFNGQIYNTDNILKSGIVSVSDRLSSSDTTILYAVVEKLGWEFDKVIDGMYAIALYNRQERKIRLYRDITGQKPFYYYCRGGKFIYSSEIRGILTHDIDREVDDEAVGMSAFLGYLPGRETLFKHIRRVGLSEAVEFALDTHELTNIDRKKTECLYDFTNPHAAIARTVGDHLLAKDAVAINLSGGLDSSIILYEASKTNKKIHSFTTVYDIKGYKTPEYGYNNDATIARRFAADMGVEHEEVLITKDDYYDTFVETYQNIEEPDYNRSLPAHLFLAKYQKNNASIHFKSILTGDGGDEIFYGYDSYYHFFVRENKNRFIPPWLYKMLYKMKHAHLAKEVDAFDFSSDVARFLMAKRLAHFHNKINFPVLAKRYEHHFDRYCQCAGFNRFGENGAGMLKYLVMDRAFWLPGEGFLSRDKLYMSQSLELRAPFSCHSLRLYMDQCEANRDTVDLEQSKKFLRKMYEDKLPRYILEKGKTGWRAPIDLWFNQKFRQLFLDIVAGQRGRRQDNIDWDRVHDTIRNAQHALPKHMYFYISLAILGDMYQVEF